MADVHSDRNGDSKYLSTTEELHDSRWRVTTTIVQQHTIVLRPPEILFSNYTVRPGCLPDSAESPLQWIGHSMLF